jgi:predicted transporter
MGNPGRFAGLLYVLTSIVLPQYQSESFQYICFPPMALAEVMTGFYLMLFAVCIERKTLAAPATSALDA